MSMRSSTTTAQTGRSIVIDGETFPVIRSWTLDDTTVIEYRMFGGTVGAVRTQRLPQDR